MPTISNTGTYLLSNNTGLESNSSTNNNYWSNSTRLMNDLKTGSAAISAKNITKRHTDQAKTNCNTQFVNIPSTERSIYAQPLERKKYLENSKINPKANIVTKSQKQQKTNNGNLFLSAVSDSKDLSVAEPSKEIVRSKRDYDRSPPKLPKMFKALIGAALVGV
jgi:hypothetical protein